ncbi:MAG: glycosyl transferase family 51 [Thiothrix nivea]|nr:MAG: glycosyl transferase family 51 [Thiothrix nivea]
MTVVLGGLLLSTAYYANEVRLAKEQTPKILNTVRQSYGTQLSVADLLPQQRTMLLAIEDPGFMQHRGVDLSTPGAGMTTITQGLVKQLYFPDGFRPGIGKIRQTLIAHHVLDSLLSKDEQLTLLLNIAYFGHQNGESINGFATAAQTYFGKSFSELTDDEFVALVAMLIGPNNLKPGSEAHEIRMQRIQQYLAGNYQPVSLWDVEYDGKRRGGTMAELLIIVLAAVILDE